MASLLPPKPEFRIWKGEKMQVTSMYSAAGLSTSFLLDTPGGRFMMEAGDGCLRDLFEIERELDRDPDISTMDINARVESFHGVIISHPHYDHYAGLLNLLNFLHLMGRRSDFKIMYPLDAKPIKMLANHFLETLWEPCPFQIDFVEFDEGRRYEVEGHVIETIPVVHRYSRPGAVGDRVPAMAYSIEYEGERVAYSGDTGGADELEPFLSDAYLAIVEATFVSVPEGHEEVHLNLETSRKLGEKARDHWLVHFTSSSWAEYMKNY